MNVLLTGGGGFAMSVLANTLVASQHASHVVLVDRAAPDSAMRAALAKLGERASWVEADIRDIAAMNATMRRYSIKVVVHGAALTLVPEWERARPADYIAVNTTGTTSVLEAVRETGLPLRRFIHVSSCAVYGDGTAGIDPQPESGPTVPSDLYGVSKLAAEMIVGRYASLFDVPAVVVRPGKLFGPMERPTHARSLMSAPYHLAVAMTSRNKTVATPRTFEASLDWLSATDAAHAFMALISAERPLRPVYNVGLGRRVGFRELASIAEAYCGHPLVVMEQSNAAELDLDPDEALGKDAASDIAAATSDLGWQPRPFRDQVRSYLDWARTNSEQLRADSQRAS